jgi:hypothetical protein
MQMVIRNGKAILQRMIQGRPRRLVEVFKVPYVRGVLNDDYFRQPYVLKEMSDEKGDKPRV